MPKGAVQAARGRLQREAIVDAAIQVFASRGFRGGALALVADRVGLTAPAVLYHFGTKENLLLAVLKERDRRAVELGQTAPAEGLASLRGLVRFAEQSQTEPGLTALHTVLQAESFEPGSPAHRYFRVRSRNLRRFVEQTIRDAQQTGEARADIDPVATGDQFVAFLEGAAMVWLIDPAVSLVELYRNYIDGLIERIGDPGHVTPGRHQ
jgi:AcrR family transcriptional regulator